MKLHLISTKHESENVRSFIFQPEQPIQWQPGQYLHYVLEHPNPDDKGTERWFTIATAPYQKHIMITTRMDNLPVSTFKTALNLLKEDATIEADGPSGKFILREGNHKHVLIAGGIGITPFHSMLAQRCHDNVPANAVLFYANRDNNFVYDEELTNLQAKDPTIDIRKFVDKKLTETDLAPFAEEDSSVFYLSGPKAMVQNYEGVLSSLGVNEENIMTDYFPGY
jgi:ferredoxin-NADP reductase